MIRQLKILAVAASLLGLVSTASAQMEVTGKARVRAETMEFPAFANGQVDVINMGVDVNMKWTPDPKVMFFFQPKFVKTMGAASAAGTGAVCTGTNNSGGTCDSAMAVHQAYTMFTHSDKISYTFGRYEMKYGDELVIGPLGWSMVGRSFDGLKAHWTVNDMVWADLFYNKVTESGAVGNTDHNFYGIYIGGKNLGPIGEADLYYLVNSNMTTSIDPKTADRQTTGVRLKGAAASVDYRVEYTTQSGKDNSGFQPTNGDIKDADQTNAEVGFKMGDTRIAAEYFNANKNYNQLYPTGHKWLGFADLFQRRNLTGFVLHVSHKFMDHMSVNLDYHTFNRVDKTATTAGAVYGLAGNLAGNAGTSYGNAGTADAVGTEIDLTLSCTQNKNLVWTGGYSMFAGGDYWKQNGGSTNDKVNYYYLMATTNF